MAQAWKDSANKKYINFGALYGCLKEPEKVKVAQKATVDPSKAWSALSTIEKTKVKNAWISYSRTERTEFIDQEKVKALLQGV